MKRQAAFLIAATRSGAGKTTLTLGIMAALKARGLRVQPFKCGPDFIDPTLHKLVTGTISYNLDLKMMGPRCCQELFSEKGRGGDVLVVEGVMGLFDGGSASTAELAKALDVPVILIIDAQSAAESAVAVLKGFELFDRKVKLAGAIFNRIGSPRHRQLIESALAGHTELPIFGYMPRDERFTIAERHLGLVMGEEKPLSEQEIAMLAETVENHLDLDAMLSCAEVPAGFSAQPEVPPARSRAAKKIAYALDEAFCFYYPQNLEILRLHGFELISFSPLRDRRLPPGAELLYFGGGYPENHARQLSENHEMLAAVRQSHVAGMPIYAECGGFMYLCAGLLDQQGHSFEMANIFPFTTRMNNRLRRLGYREVTLRRTCLLGRAGEVLHGHEFHYSEIDAEEALSENMPEWLYQLDTNSYEGYSSGSALGSYVHLHFAATPQAVEHLYRYV